VGSSHPVNNTIKVVECITTKPLLPCDESSSYLLHEDTSGNVCTTFCQTITNHIHFFIIIELLF